MNTPRSFAETLCELNHPALSGVRDELSFTDRASADVVLATMDPFERSPRLDAVLAAASVARRWRWVLENSTHEDDLSFWLAGDLTDPRIGSTIAGAYMDTGARRPLSRHSIDWLLGPAAASSANLVDLYAELIPALDTADADRVAATMWENMTSMERANIYNIAAGLPRVTAALMRVLDPTQVPIRLCELAVDDFEGWYSGENHAPWEPAHLIDVLCVCANRGDDEVLSDATEYLCHVLYVLNGFVELPHWEQWIHTVASVEGWAARLADQSKTAEDCHYGRLLVPVPEVLTETFAAAFSAARDGEFTAAFDLIVTLVTEAAHPAGDESTGALVAAGVLAHAIAASPECTPQMIDRILTVSTQAHVLYGIFAGAARYENSISPEAYGVLSSTIPEDARGTDTLDVLERCCTDVDELHRVIIAAAAAGELDDTADAVVSRPSLASETILSLPAAALVVAGHVNTKRFVDTILDQVGADPVVWRLLVELADNYPGTIGELVDTACCTQSHLV